MFFHDTAFEAKTGKVLWQKNVGSGKGSPVVWTVEDKTYFICGGGYCVEPRTGRLLWSTSENVKTSLPLRTVRLQWRGAIWR